MFTRGSSIQFVCSTQQVVRKSLRSNATGMCSVLTESTRKRNLWTEAANRAAALLAGCSDGRTSLPIGTDILEKKHPGVGNREMTPAWLTSRAQSMRTARWLLTTQRGNIF